MIAPTTTKTTVHVPCIETAFRAIENDNIPEPAMAVSMSCLISDIFDVVQGDDGLTQYKKP